MKTPTKPNHIYLIYIYKEDLALNNQQWLICHKTRPTNQPTYQPNHTLPKNIGPKVTVMTRLEFERADYDITVQHIHNYFTGIHPRLL